MVSDLKIWGLASWALALLVLVFSPASADEERAVLSGNFEAEQFIAGKEVLVESATLDDLFAAGGEVVLDQVDAQDVFAAGGSLRFRKTAVEGLRAAGGEIDIAAEVRGSLIAAGGRLRLRPEALVQGYAVLAGGDVELEGEIKGNLKAAGGRIRLTGVVEGDVDLAGRRITIGPTARIGGKLTYRSPEDAEIAPEAVVAGGIKRIEVELLEISLAAGIGIAVGLWIVLVVGLGIVGVVLHATMPELIAGAAAVFSTRPWACVGLGFALLIATPVAVSLLFMTILGIPLALFVLAVYGVVLAPALITAAYGLGMRTARVFGWSHDGEQVSWRMLWTFLGLVALALIALVPVLGFLVLVVALALGLGGFVLRFRHHSALEV